MVTGWDKYWLSAKLHRVSPVGLFCAPAESAAGERFGPQARRRSRRPRGRPRRPAPAGAGGGGGPGRPGGGGGADALPLRGLGAPAGRGLPGCCIFSSRLTHAERIITLSRNSGIIM